MTKLGMFTLHKKEVKNTEREFLSKAIKKKERHFTFKTISLR